MKKKIKNEDWPKCFKCGQKRFVYHKKVLGIKKEANIPIEEMRRCKKCNGKIEIKYIGKDYISTAPIGYLTLFTCVNCGEKRILDETMLL